VATKLANLPPISNSWIDSQGRPTQAFAQFMSALAANTLGPLPSAANDAAAAKVGVPVNGLYQASGVVRIRIA
jgi:hypothetical protein